MESHIPNTLERWFLLPGPSTSPTISSANPQASLLRAFTPDAHGQREKRHSWLTLRERPFIRGALQTLTQTTSQQKRSGLLARALRLEPGARVTHLYRDVPFRHLPHVEAHRGYHVLAELARLERRRCAESEQLPVTPGANTASAPACTNHSLFSGRRLRIRCFQPQLSESGILFAPRRSPIRETQLWNWVFLLIAFSVKKGNVAQLHVKIY